VVGYFSGVTVEPMVRSTSAVISATMFEEDPVRSMHEEPSSVEFECCCLGYGVIVGDGVGMDLVGDSLGGKSRPCPAMGCGNKGCADRKNSASDRRVKTANSMPAFASSSRGKSRICKSLHNPSGFLVDRSVLGALMYMPLHG